MSRLKDRQDAFGHGMYDFYHGRAGIEIAERDDGWLTSTGGPSVYFADHDQWPGYLKRSLRLVRGRVLDVGCGAGRIALRLQEKGLDVLGIDNSPLAVKVCKLRGVRATRVMSLTEVSRKLGTFDTIVMCGGNFGLVGNPGRARWLLRRFHGVTSDRGRIVAHARDPYDTDEPSHVAYHKRNRRRGRPSGQLRIRIRYKAFIGPWIDLLLVSEQEMADLAVGTGWRLDRCLKSSGSSYVAVLEKEAQGKTIRGAKRGVLT